MKIQIALVALLVFIMSAGCADERSDVRVSLVNCGGWATCPDFLVSISDGLWNYEVVLNASNRSIGPVPTKSSGTLKISISVRMGDRDTETNGYVELPLKKDWRWGIDMLIQENDPIDVCFGCFGSKEYELDPILGYDQNERLYIVWGGNSISDPVTY